MVVLLCRLYNQPQQNTMENTQGIARAVALAGTQDKLAQLLGVTQQAVAKWVSRGWVPVRRAQEIEAITGVPRASLLNPRLKDLVDLPEAVE